MPSDQFYTRLPVNEIPLGELLLEDHLFYKLPEDWSVVITDIRNSTAAIQEGKHETINLIATGSIVAVLNIAYKAGITVPFFFGGDGASFIIPSSLLSSVMNALQQYHDQTQENFELDIRVGHVSINEIYNAGQKLTVAKWRSTKVFSIPIVLGDGLAYAERKIKGIHDNALPANSSTDLDLQGMQCRWDLIKPPAGTEEVVSLIAIAPPGGEQTIAFKQVIDLLDSIYGEPAVRQPISLSRLKLKTTLKRIGTEMRARMGGFNLLYGIRSWITGTLGVYYFKTKTGREYLERLINMADTLVVDGRINTVISGSATQREQLIKELDKLEAMGEISYGISTSAESVMSCYVRDLHDGHVHFVDGSLGGYTRAAVSLKSKLQPL